MGRITEMLVAASVVTAVNVGTETNILWFMDMGRRS